MSSYLISCFNQETKELEYFTTDYSVYVYIKQLECSIRYKSDSIKNLYPGRFIHEVINEH